MVLNHISSVNKKVQRRKTSQTWRTREVENTSFVLQKKGELLFKLWFIQKKKYSHALLSASAFSVRCGAMKKQNIKSNSYPLVNVEIIKKSEIAKEESRKVKLKKARWRHFYHNTSCNILWFSFEDYLLIRLQKSQKESERKTE